MFAQASKNPAEVNVYPPNPTAASLGKFGEIPVGLYTGTAQIDIPIWEVKEGNISLPVSLSYHSRGIQAQEVAPWVGLGWALNAGGVITRTVRGLPDDQANGFLSNSWPLPTQSQLDAIGVNGVLNSDAPDAIDKYARGWADSEPDVFYFNFGNRSGKFQYDQAGTLFMAPLQRINIQSQETGPTKKTKFTITTEDGFIYIFDQRDNTRSYSMCNGMGSIPADYYTSSWFLSKITSPSGSVVTLEYDVTGALFYPTGNYGTTYVQQSIGSGRVPCGKSNVSCVNYSDNQSGVRLRKIKFSAGEIEFIPGPNRVDLPGDYRLDTIIVRDYKLKNLRKFQFGYQYMYGSDLVNAAQVGYSVNDAPAYRLALVSLKETDGTGTISKKPYQFTYTLGLPSRLSNSIDHWGYYNGVANSTTVPAAYWNGQYYSGAAREPRFDFATAGSLNKIIYPTGGSTSFTYELNTASVGVPAFADRSAQLDSDPINNQSGQAGVIAPKQIAFTVNNASTLGTIITITTSQLPCDDPTVPCGIYYTIAKNINGSPGTADADVLFDSRSLFNPTAPTVDRSAKLINLPNGNYFITLQKYPDIVYYNSQVPYHPFFLKINWQEELAGEDPLVGGLRIKKMEDYDPVSGKTIKKSYDYKNGGGPTTGRIYNMPQYGYFYAEGDVLNDDQCWSEYFTRTSSPNAPLTMTQGGQVGYGVVTVLHGEEVINSVTRTGVNGKSVYTFTTPETYSYRGAANANKGINFPFTPINDCRTWMGGTQLQVIDYRYDPAGSGAWYPVKKVENEYLFHDEYYNMNSNIGSARALKVGFINFSTYQSSLAQYAYEYYDFYTGYKELTKTTETIYDDDITKFTTKQTNFAYSLNHLQMINSVTNLSDGNKIVSWFTYSPDYTNTSGFIQDMKTAKIIDRPIEQYTYLTNPTGGNPRVISGQITIYNSGGNGLEKEKWNLEISQPTALSAFKISNKAVSTVDPLSASNQDFVQENNYRKKLTFSSYDAKGNLTGYNKENDIQMTNIWGYNNIYPVAEIKNATPNQVFYESFEENVNGVNLTDASNRNIAKTGRKVGSNTYTITNSFPTGTSYKMSYWYYDGTKWNYSGILNYTSSISLTAGYKLDEIRVFPVNSIMTTYTYDPLVGMTSTTDVNGFTTYYEYDGLGRLLVVRDNDGNIVQHYDYHYKP